MDTWPEDFRDAPISIGDVKAISVLECRRERRRLYPLIRDAQIAARNHAIEQGTTTMTPYSFTILGSPLTRRTISAEIVALYPWTFVSGVECWKVPRKGDDADLFEITFGKGKKK